MFADLMRRDLCSLARTLKQDGIRLYIGGGYGLWLKTEYIERNDIKTMREVPVPRVTLDIDVFLGLEVMTDSLKFDSIRRALDGLGYEPVPGAENYQFSRQITTQAGFAQPLKIDLLAPYTSDERVKADARRIKPKGSHGLHAHVTPEAETLEEFPFELVLSDECTVFIPHPTTFLVMKLFAFRDRLDDANRNLSSYHAYDLLRIVAMTTEKELEQTRGLLDTYSESTVLSQARDIVSVHFDAPTSVGTIRLREHSRVVEGKALDEESVTQFRDDLRVLVGVS